MKNTIIILLMLVLLTGCGQLNDIASDYMSDYSEPYVWLWEDMTFLPDSYNLATPNNLLIFGNSIGGDTTKGIAGMAASSQEKDYAHLLAASLNATTLFVRNTNDFEARFWNYDVTILPTSDTVIIQLGDNVSQHENVYSIYLDNFVKNQINRGAQVILISTMLPTAQQNKNNQIKAVAIENNIPFIDCRFITLEPNTMPLTGIEHQHPNDKGMRLIAETIYNKLR